MRDLLLILIILLSFQVIAVEDEYKQFEIDFQNFIDSELADETKFNFIFDFSTRYRWQETDDGINHRNFQHRIRTGAFVNFGKDSCVTLQTRIMSGSGFSSDFNDSGLTDFEKDNPNEKIGVRNFFIDIHCLNDKLKVKAGALVPESEGFHTPRSSGWVDGIEVTYLVKNIIDSIKVTYGQIDVEGDINFFKRDFNGANYVKIEVQKEISKNIEGTLIFQEYEEEDYISAIVDYSLRDLPLFFDEAHFEATFNNLSQNRYVVELEKEMHKGKLRVGYARYEKGESTLPVHSFWAQENGSFHVIYTRKISKSWKLRLQGRTGEDGQRYEVRAEYKF